MWTVWFLVTWAMFMTLLVLTIVHEDRKDARLLAEINHTLTDTLALTRSTWQPRRIPAPHQPTAPG